MTAPETFKVRVEGVTPLTPRIKSIAFQVLDGKSMPYKAGQHVQIFVPREGSAPHRTYYSIASPPRRKDRFELCVAHVPDGPASVYLHSRRPGDVLDAAGPGGKFIMPDAPPRDCVFVAAGSGVAPLRAMVLDMFDRRVGKRARLVFGNRFEEDIAYRAEWEELARRYEAFTATFVLSKGGRAWRGASGYAQDHLAGIAGAGANDFYICGMAAMVDAVKQKLAALGVPDDQVHYERYG